jgi:hypothetical protein
MNAGKKTQSRSSISDVASKIGPYAKKAVHWGFIPTIIVLGMTCTEPRPSLAQVLGPM